MNGKGLSSPIFLRHLKAFDVNPKSRVFAPLAENYRKLGMIDKAMKVLQIGLKHNPDYPTGNLVLAFCYYDLNKYSEAYNVLKPFCSSNRDNIRLQKLFADLCRGIGNFEEALETYKYLLFINPKDKDVGKWVQELESSNLSGEKEKIVDIFELDEISDHPKDSNDIDGWVKVDLADGDLLELDSDDNSSGELPVSLAHELKNEKIEVVQDENVDVVQNDEEAPVITHTLVDLYLDQGYYDKAYEILEKILILNPVDKRTIQKLDEVKKRISSAKEESVTVKKDEKDQSLMDLYDSKIGIGEHSLKNVESETEVNNETSEKNEVLIKLLEEKMFKFLDALKERAKLKSI